MNAAHEVPPACGPQTNTDATFYYTCPFCEATVSSSVRSGQVNHRRHCGNRFRVKDGCVAGKKRVYQCPFCAGEVSSNVMTGQINHRSVCGNQFYVFLCKDRQSQRCDAKTYAHMPAVPSDRVVGMRLRPNPRAAHHTSGRKERSIGNQRLSDASRKSAGQRPADGQGRREAFKARLLPTGRWPKAPGSIKAKLRKAAKSAGKSAAESLYASYCLTLLSEATGEARRKRPADGERRAEEPEGGQKRRQRRGGPFVGRLLPNVAF